MPPTLKQVTAYRQLLNTLIDRIRTRSLWSTYIIKMMWIEAETPELNNNLH